LKIIEVGPMVTHQTRFADYRLALRPGTDGALALGMPPYFKYRESGFPTPSGKMEFTSSRLKEIGQEPLPVYREPARQYTLVLGTGTRLPMFMHSRTFRNSWNKKLSPDAFVMINSSDAAARSIADNDEVILSTPRSSIRVKAKITDVIAPGVANIYHGWLDVEVNELIDSDYLDPVSGFPGFKSLICQIEKSSEGDSSR
jgi:anaerobic selenocysteine-containing dehydrogenase